MFDCGQSPLDRLPQRYPPATAELLGAQAEGQQLLPCPGVVGQPCRTRGRRLERHVFAHEVVVHQVRIQTQLQVTPGLGQTQRLSRQGRLRLAQRQSLS